MWPEPIVWILVIWSSYPNPFVCLQSVRQLGHLFEYSSSDHPLPSTSSVSRTYVNYVNCFMASNLIILFHRLQPQRVCKLGRLFEYSSSDQSIPTFSSAASTWTWSMVWILDIWSSHPISIYLQFVRELCQLFQYLCISYHPLHAFLVSTWI